MPYRLNDAISSIGLGVLSQIAGVFTRVFRVGIYVLVFDSFALVQWDIKAWWALPLALVFYDFCYYWHHRFMHHIALMWAVHVVHHSSDDYNLSTALRQTSTGAWFAGEALPQWVLELAMLWSASSMIASLILMRRSWRR